VSFIADSRKPGGLGFLPLQHKDYNSGNPAWSVDMRASILALRITGRQDSGIGLGHWTYDPDSVGDVLGGLCWPNESSRSIPAWEFAWPVVTQPIGTPTIPAGPACGTFQNDITLRPVKDSEYRADDRFKKVTTTARPKREGVDAWPKFPWDWFGIALTTTEEHKQTEIFMPTDPRLVAVHRAGDHKMGSMLCDLRGDFTVDQTRVARLQSPLRVIKRPLNQANVIAFNLTHTGCGDTRGGYFVDGEFYDGGLGSSSDIVIGRGSRLDGGPFDCGNADDLHYVGDDADGNPISTLHISAHALYKLSNEEDGPLAFEGGYPEAVGAGPHQVSVHIGFDPGFGMWRLWADATNYVVT